MKVENHRKIGLFLIGLMTLIFGLLELRTVFTFKFSLTPLKGTITNVNTYITTVSDRRGHQGQKSEFIFHLRGKDKQFVLARNIGDAYIDEEFESFKRDIERADSVTVWIRKSEVDETYPKIFQIQADDTIILSHEIVRTENSLLAFFLIFLGLGSLTLFGFIQFPDRMRKIFRINDPATKNL